MKRSSEELLVKNREMANKGISEHELELLKSELEAEKRKSMGIEEYANKKLKDYERKMEE